MSYPGHSLGGRSYPSAEKQSVYSTAPADWASQKLMNPFIYETKESTCIHGDTEYFDIVAECSEQYWTSPGGNTQQGTNYTATCLPSRKLSKLDEPDMQDTAEEARTSS